MADPRRSDGGRNLYEDLVSLLWMLAFIGLLAFGVSYLYGSLTIDALVASPAAGVTDPAGGDPAGDAPGSEPADPAPGDDPQAPADGDDPGSDEGSGEGDPDQGSGDGTGEEGTGGGDPGGTFPSGHIEFQPTPLVMYRVQVGAFQERSRADRHTAELAEAGYPTWVITGGSFLRVVSGVFPEREAAVTYADDVAAEDIETLVSSIDINGSTLVLTDGSSDTVTRARELIEMMTALLQQGGAYWQAAYGADEWGGGVSPDQRRRLEDLTGRFRQAHSAWQESSADWAHQAEMEELLRQAAAAFDTLEDFDGMSHNDVGASRQAWADGMEAYLAFVSRYRELTGTLSQGQ